jgi:pimeloyl-ACP methyl ester carboxylesterase
VVVSNLRRYGAPPFVVAVVHGGPGAPGEMAPVARELSQIAGVLEPLQTAATIQAQVEELRTILEDNASLPLTLIGFSWGAWLSCILASFHPELITKLILVSSGPIDQKYASSIMKTRLRRLRGADKKEAAFLYHALTVSASSDDNYCRSLSRLSELISKADSFDLLPDKDDNAQLDMDIYRTVWDEASRLRGSGRLFEIVQHIKRPIVAIHGDYDPHPANGVKYPLSAAVRDFRFILLERCGHYPWRERSARDTFYRILKAEIRQQ